MEQYKILKDLVKFNTIKENEKENAYEIPYATMNVGTMNAGSDKNSVLAYCEISIDFRIAGQKPYSNLLKILKKYYTI